MTPLTFPQGRGQRHSVPSGHLCFPSIPSGHICFAQFQVDTSVLLRSIGTHLFSCEKWTHLNSSLYSNLHRLLVHRCFSCGKRRFGVAKRPWPAYVVNTNTCSCIQKEVSGRSEYLYSQERRRAPMHNSAERRCDGAGRGAPV